MKYQTKRQEMYLDEVLRLHREKGYGEYRISRLLPISHATVSRWIGVFAAGNKGQKIKMRKSKGSKASQSVSAQVVDVKALQTEIARLEAALKHERMRADACDEMIDIAEIKFNIAIRKKAGAKR